MPIRRRTFAAAFALLAASALACERGVPPETRAIPSALPEASREASRRLPLDGAHNARDLGGYAGVDGRRVRWGRLYRSDALGELSDDDVSYLARLGVQQVVDFRSDLEREREPDRLPASPAPRVVLRPIFGEALDPQTLRDRILSGGARRDEMAEMLVAGNRAFVTEFAGVYSDFLRDLANPENLPVLFHCTAGKDRTGILAAVVLAALGVSDDDIVHDYMLTAECRTARDAYLQVHDPDYYAFVQSLPAAIREMDAESIPTMLRWIRDEHGSVTEYLRAGGVDQVTLTALQANLLER